MYEDINFLKNLEILFVEDDDELSSTMINSLSYLFKKVYHAKNGIEAFTIYLTMLPDIILTDIKMDKMDGMELIQEIRKKDVTIPIVFLTSYSQQKFLMEAVNNSADGYILKPVDLNSMIQTLIKASSRNNFFTKNISLSPSIQYDILKKELTIDGTIIELSTKEHLLLKLFIRNINKPLTKEDINYYLYPLESVTDSAIKNLIARLRDKIDSNIIIYIKGAGWKLNLRK